MAFSISSSACYISDGDSANAIDERSRVSDVTTPATAVFVFVLMTYPFMIIF
jgi:hypothetical protein